MNTTFTTYAEKKAKQILNLLQGYTKGIRITAILVLLLLGVSNAWAANYPLYVNYPYIYLDNSSLNWNGCNVVIGHDSYSYGYLMTKIDHTKLFYKEIPSEWKDAKGIVFINQTSQWGEYKNQSLWDRTNTQTRTGYKWENEYESMDYHKTYLCSSTGNTNLTITYKSGGYSDLNQNQTVYKYTSTDGGSSYSAQQINSGNVTISAYKMTGNGVASNSNNQKSINTATTTSQTISAAYTGEVTLTASANSGYEFVGWFSSTSSTSAVSTNSTYTYNAPSSTKSVYARFKKITYNVAGSMNGWSTSKNPMTITGDIAESTIHLNAGDHEFKIVKNGDTWHTMNSTSRDISRTSNTNVDFSTTGGNDNNTWLHADATGNYTFQYNITNKTLTVIYPELQYYLVGDFGSGWDSEGVQFVDGKVTKALTKRERPEYTFKVKASNGKHYTAENKEMLQFTRQHTTEVISDNTDYNSEPYYNLSLQADVTGQYTFEFDPATFELTVTHPEYSPKAAYLVGDFSDQSEGTDDDNSGKDWTEEHGKQFTTNANQTEGTVEICDWTGQNSTWNFKIKINGVWYGLKETMNTSGRWILTDDYAHLSTKNCTIQTNGKDGCYTFRYTTLNNGDIELQIVFPNDTRIVTFDKNNHGTTPAQQTILYGKTATKPIMDDADGYMFAGWYTNAACTAGKEYDFDTPVESDIRLYAKWIPYTQCIFFKNTLGWKDVFVYTFSDKPMWDDGTGVHPSTNKLEQGEMTQIGETDIFYYVLTNSTGFNYIAFTDYDMRSYGFFNDHNVIYRGDRSDQLQLFIPEKNQQPTGYQYTTAKYYSTGLWMKYNSTVSGYDWSSNVNDWNNTTNTFTAEKAGGYSFTTEVKLTAGTTYEFKIHNLNNTWFGNGGTMTQNRCTNWQFWDNNGSNAKITPTITGNYVFTLYLGDGEVRVSLDYPLSVNDYRLVYKDNTHGAHDGHYIKKRTDIAEQRDTVSFFIHKDNNNSPQILLQYCSAISNDGKPTWTTSKTYNSLGDAVTTTAVYNFILKQTNSGNPHTCSIVTEETHKYTGNFYIRTDAAAGGWKTFRQEGNRMTYSSFAESNTNPKFNHYFCEWISANQNVKFTIANDYSYCISDTLDGDNIIDKNGVSPGCLPADANVRFGWDSRDNSISRAYIAGSGHKKDRFLVIEGNADLKDIDGNAYTGNTGEGQERFNLKDHEVVLEDMGNWIYQMDVTANSKTKYKLTALYDGIVQYFKGTSTETESMLATDSQDDDTSFEIRLIYDFKTNHIVAAWLADDVPGELGADMMVIRENQGYATQIAFNGEELTNVQKAYAVMTFTKEFVNGSKPIHERKHYWISFPFDVNINEVFGFSEYMDHWILQLYDGQKRADEGWWYESGTFWKYITNKNYTLKKGVGYVLTLDLSKMGESSNVFENTDEVSLYFPSTGLINTISGEVSTSTTVAPHECTIERENRKIYDSHWNIIGVPGFADISGYSTEGTQEKPIINLDTEHGGGPSFYYEYLPSTNSYQATNKTANFQTMYGYMVQYTGNLSWITTIAVPNNIAARRNSDNTEPEKVSLRLEIAQDEVMADQTFVQLQQEGATAEFDMNLDLTKIINSGANIYTLAGEQRIQSAGNALPMGEVIVPVGVKIATEGEYTFRMPDGTEGMVVELIDYERDITTNLLLFDYTVTLPAGSNESRFALHIQPNKSGVTTGVEGAYPHPLPKGKGAKFLIDGKLIIRTAEGVIYDAQGHVVQ